MILADDSSLFIRDINLQDEGFYECKRRQTSGRYEVITKAFVAILTPTTKAIATKKTYLENDTTLSSRLQSVKESKNNSKCKEVEFDTQLKISNKCNENKTTSTNKYEKEVFIVLLSLFVVMVVLISILLYPNKCKRRKPKMRNPTDSIASSWKHEDLI